LNNQIKVRKSFIDSGYGAKEIVYPKVASPKKLKRKAESKPAGESKSLKK
jgi:hypothetical protein